MVDGTAGTTTTLSTFRAATATRAILSTLPAATTARATLFILSAGISAGTGKLSRACATLSESLTSSTAQRCAVRGTQRSISARTAANGAVTFFQARESQSTRSPATAEYPIDINL